MLNGKTKIYANKHTLIPPQKVSSIVKVIFLFSSFAVTKELSCNSTKVSVGIIENENGKKSILSLHP